MKKLMLLFGFVTIVVVTSIFSCQNEKKADQTSPQNPTSTIAPKIYGKTIGLCTCDPTYTNPHCDDCVTSHFMNGNTTKTSWVTWTSCTSDDPKWTNCSPTPTTQTKLTFCYGDAAQQGVSTDCNLYMEVTDPPACIRCITYSPFCEKMKATCTQHGTDVDVTIVYNDPSTNTAGTITFTYSTDPFITITCTSIHNSQQYTYSCTGSF